jgi:succinate dehydrogenase/fumarate reductase flavoprotein subunit
MARSESRGLHYTLDHPETDQTRGRHDTLIRLADDSRHPVLGKGPLSADPLPEGEF